MKRISVSTLLLSTMLLVSCTRILLWKEGIKQPALETHDRLRAFLVKQQLDTSEILCFRDTNALNRFYGMQIGFPDARFFNRQKQLIDYREKPEDCNAQVGVFLQKMDSINLRPADPKLKLDDFIRDLAYASNLKPFQLEPVPYDVYLVIYWAKYLGKVNKNKVFEWEELAAQARQKGLKIRVIKVTVDYQALWGITPAQLPAFDY